MTFPDLPVTSPSDHRTSDGGSHIEYALDDWAVESRQMLRQLLTISACMKVILRRNVRAAMPDAAVRWRVGIYRASRWTQQALVKHLCRF